MVERTGKTRQPRAPMSAARAAAIIDHLEAREIVVWLEGAWGVDALLGRQTREHDDLDVILSMHDVAPLVAGLEELGYRVGRGGPPTSFELVDDEGHQVDAHPVTFTPKGEAVYRMEEGGDWIYPAGSLTGRGEIAGRRVGCLTPEMALTCHALGYALDGEHRRDVHALAERYGLPLPAYRSA